MYWSSFHIIYTSISITACNTVATTDNATTIFKLFVWPVLETIF